MLNGQRSKIFIIKQPNCIHTKSRRIYKTILEFKSQLIVQVFQEPHEFRGSAVGSLTWFNQISGPHTSSNLS